MSWFTATDVSVANGDTLVYVDATADDIADVVQRDGLIIEEFPPVDIVRAYIDGSSNKIIELRSAWPYATQNNVAARVQPTSGDFRTATRAITDITTVVDSNYTAMDAWITNTSGTVTFTNLAGDSIVVPTLQQVSGGTWAYVNDTNITIQAFSFKIVSCSTASRDVILPVTIAVGEDFKVKNSKDSSFDLIVRNPNFSIRTDSATYAAGSDITLTPGQSLHMVALSSTNLESI